MPFIPYTAHLPLSQPTLAPHCLLFSVVLCTLIPLIVLRRLLYLFASLWNPCALQARAHPLIGFPLHHLSLSV